MTTLRWNSFFRSVLFSLAAAGAALPWWTLARPFLGGARSLSIYLVAVMAAYLAGLAAERSRRLATFVVAGAVGSFVALAAHSFTELAIGLAVVLAVGRSVFLYPTSAARAVAIELALTGGGLVFARFLAGGALVSIVLSLWGFFLVQSLYFLFGTATSTRSREEGRHPDPFEDVHGRAIALLERP